jgi:two-component system chemotaxis response regulator CheB
MQGHDIIVVGGSAGGVDAISAIVRGLPANFRGAVFVVVHMAAGYDSVLPDILSRKGPLRATHAIHGEPIEGGHIYVAPPDNHILVRPGFLAVQRGPKENGFRPAVDPLFRSAAMAFGPRVVAVLVSGHLDCGTLGLASVKARGGLAIVQDPSEASVADMPRSAIDHIKVDYIRPVAEIGPLLAQLAGQPVRSDASAPPSSQLLELEGEEPGLRSDIVCPICQGALTEAQLAGVSSFRCHVGHAFSSAALLAEQAESLERALWAATRALEESARLALRMAPGSKDLRARMNEKARTQFHQADVVRRMLLGAGSLTMLDAEKEAQSNGPSEPTKPS